MIDLRVGETLDAVWADGHAKASVQEGAEYISVEVDEAVIKITGLSKGKGKVAVQTIVGSPITVHAEDIPDSERQTDAVHVLDVSVDT